VSPQTKKRGAHSRGSHGGGGDHHGDEGGGGGGGGGGKLVKVGFARNQAEAEMLQGLLTESGIPSILKRSGGFDAPEFLAAGPRDIWVNKEHAREARRILEETMTEGDDEAEERAELEGEAHLRKTGGDPMTPGRLALWVGAAFIAAVIIIWIVYTIAS
jgi:Putative prokaryotic signal transducing protein